MAQSRSGTHRPRPLSELGSGMTVRGWIVLAMVTVAVVGAITAFRGAKTAQDTAILSQRLAEGELLELATSQSVESQELAREALNDRDTVLLRDGGSFMSAAADARKAGQAPEKADWLEMRAEEEFAADRAILRVRRQFRELPAGGPACPSPRDVKLSPSDKMQQEVAVILARLGIETTWCDPRCGPGPGDRAGAAACVRELGAGANGDSASSGDHLERASATNREPARARAVARLRCSNFYGGLGLLYLRRRHHQAPTTLGKVGAVRQRSRRGPGHFRRHFAPGGHRRLATAARWLGRYAAGRICAVAYVHRGRAQGLDPSSRRPRARSPRIDRTGAFRHTGAGSASRFKRPADHVRRRRVGGDGGAQRLIRLGLQLVGHPR